MILETPQKRNKWKGRLQKIWQSAMLMAALSGAPKWTFAQNTATTTNLNSQTEMLTSPPQKVVRLQEKMEIPAGSPMHFIQENIHKIPQALQDHYHELMRLYEQEYQLVHISKVPAMNQYLEDIFRYVEDPVQRLRAGLIFIEAIPGDHNQDGREILGSFLDQALEENILDEEMLSLYVDSAIEEMFDWSYVNFYDKKVLVFNALKEEIKKDKEYIAESREYIEKWREEIEKDKEYIAELNKRGIEWFNEKEIALREWTVDKERLLWIKNTILIRRDQLNLDLEKDYPLIWKVLYQEKID